MSIFDVFSKAVYVLPFILLRSPCATLKLQRKRKPAGRRREEERREGPPCNKVPSSKRQNPKRSSSYSPSLVPRPPSPGPRSLSSIIHCVLCSYSERGSSIIISAFAGNIAPVSFVGGMKSLGIAG